jgi:acetyltransferase-like isoleucine patch superfamily enzyme
MLKNILIGQYLSKSELFSIGFKKLGNNVLIDRSVIIPHPHNISIGNNVRIDAYSIITSLKGKIDISDYVHIAPYNLIHCGTNKTILFDKHTFSAAGSKLYGKTDEYLGNFLINPTHNDEHVKQISGDIIFQKYSGLGASSTIFPNSIIPEGTVFGANSLFTGNKELKPWSIYVGNPLKFYKERNKNCLEMSKNYI